MNIGTGHIAQALRSTVDKWDLIKCFCKAKDTISKTKKQSTEWEKIFIISPSYRGPIYKIHKELKKLDTYKLNNQIKGG